MGESQKQSFQLSFNRFLRVGFQGSRVTSDGGLILVQELDERLGFSKLIAQHLMDSRRGLGGTAAAGDRATAKERQGRNSLSRRCRLCQAGGLRGSRRARGQLCHSHSGQR